MNSTLTQLNAIKKAQFFSHLKSKLIVFMLFCFCWMLNFNAAWAQCPEGDPLEWDWLQNIIDSSSTCSDTEICQFNYNGETYFRVLQGQYGFCSADIPYAVYDCEGNLFCGAGGSIPFDLECNSDVKPAASENCTVIYEFYEQTNPASFKLIEGCPGEVFEFYIGLENEDGSFCEVIDQEIGLDNYTNEPVISNLIQNNDCTITFTFNGVGDFVYTVQDPNNASINVDMIFSLTHKQNCDPDAPSPTNFLLAQDWTPFPENQKTYFDFSSETLNLPALYYATNVTQQGNQIQYYLDANNTVESLGEYISNDCVENIIDGTQDFIKVTEPVSTQNGLHYYQDQLVFNTTLNVGEGFFIQSENYVGFDEVYMECIDQRTENVLGQTDDVKEFSLQAYANGVPVASAFDDFNYILSKSFGFLQFLPFTELLTEPKTKATITGFEEETGNFVGSTGDQFKPPYEAGDVIYYSQETNYQFDLEINRKWRDSITAVVHYEDSLIYTFDRLEVIKEVDYFFNNTSLAVDTLTTIDTIQSYGNQQTYVYNQLINSGVYNSIYSYSLEGTIATRIRPQAHSFSFNNTIASTVNINRTVTSLSGCYAYSPGFISGSTIYHSELGQIYNFHADDCCMTGSWSLDAYKKGDQIYPVTQLNPVYDISDTPLDVSFGEGPAIENGIFYPAFVPDSLLNQPFEITFKRGLFEYTQTVTVTGSRDGLSEIDPIFYDNLWLNNYVNPRNCNGESLQVFEKFSSVFIYLINDAGNGILIWANGVICEDDISNSTCLMEINLFNPVSTWSCNTSSLTTGCTDPSACNYLPTAAIGDNSCQYDCLDFLIRYPQFPPFTEALNICSPVNLPEPIEYFSLSMLNDESSLSLLSVEVDEQTDVQQYFTTITRTYTATDTYGDQITATAQYHVANQFLQMPEVAQPSTICEEDLWSYIKIGTDQYKIYADQNGSKGEMMSTCNTPSLICSTADFGVDTKLPNQYNFWATTYFEFPDGTICESEAMPFSVDVQAKPTAALSTQNKTMNLGEGMPLMDVVANNKSGYWSGENILYLMTATGENIAYFSANEAGVYKLYYTVRNDNCVRSYLLVVEVASAGKAAATQASYKTIDTTFNIYPNPTSNKVFIDLPGEAVYQISFTDISGKVMQQLETDLYQTNIEINVNDLPKGIYMVELKNESTQLLQKLIVE